MAHIDLHTQSGKLRAPDCKSTGEVEPDTNRQVVGAVKLEAVFAVQLNTFESSSQDSRLKRITADTTEWEETKRNDTLREKIVKEGNGLVNEQ